MGFSSGEGVSRKISGNCVMSFLLRRLFLLVTVAMITALAKTMKTPRYNHGPSVITPTNWDKGCADVVAD